MFKLEFQNKQGTFASVKKMERVLDIEALSLEQRNQLKTWASSGKTIFAQLDPLMLKSGRRVIQVGDSEESLLNLR